MEWKPCVVCGAENSVPPIKKMDVCHSCRKKNRIARQRDLTRFQMDYTKRIEMALTIKLVEYGYTLWEVRNSGEFEKQMAFRDAIGELKCIAEDLGNDEMYTALEAYYASGGKMK
jgi:hypothetical protein